MRKLLIVFILIVFMLIINADSIFVDDSYFSADKIDHFFTNVILTMGSYAAIKTINSNENEIRDIVLSISIPIVFSIGKEIYDNYSKDGEVSYKDIIYDGLGILIGILIVR